jgi:hypothetical protein
MATAKLDQLRPKRKIEMFSANYFAACTLGGIIGERLTVSVSYSSLLILS